MKIIKINSVIVGLTLLGMLLIVPIVSAQSDGVGRLVKETHYPARFERLGIINIIDRKGVVVDGVYISFSSHVQFMTPYDERSSLESFRPGQRVGYTLNKENQIVKLCLILKAKDGNS